MTRPQQSPEETRTDPTDSSHSNTRPSAQFHHQSTTSSACNCPVHSDATTRPFTAPLGLSFAGDISISSINKTEAESIYQSHHSYMTSSLHQANLAHHGIKYQDELLGAITYRFPLLSKKRLYFDTAGNVIPEPLSDADYASLPDALEPRARELIPQIDDAEVADSTVVQGDKIVSADRICLAERMPNLASAGLAASQEKFFRSESCPEQVSYLITFVRADYRGSMIRALKGKGWRCVGWTRPRQASNREYKPIRDKYKWVFVCPETAVYTQRSLSSFSSITHN